MHITHTYTASLVSESRNLFYMSDSANSYVNLLYCNLYICTHVCPVLHASVMYNKQLLLLRAPIDSAYTVHQLCILGIMPAQCASHISQCNVHSHTVNPCLQWLHIANNTML